MDLSKLSTEDLLALRQGNLSAVSTQGLMALRGSATPAVSQEPPINPAEGMSALQRGLVGAGSAARKAYLGARSLIPGLGLTQDEKDELALYERYRGNLGTAGKVGEIGGEVAMLAAPGLNGARIASMPGRIALAGGLSAAMTPGGVEERASAGAGGAIGGALGEAGARVLTKTARGLFSGSVTPDARVLMDQGINVPAWKATDNRVLRTVAERARVLPVAGTIIKGQERAAIESFNRSMADRFTPPTPVRDAVGNVLRWEQKPVGKSGTDAINALKDRFDDAYDAIYSGRVIPIDDVYGTEVRQILDQATNYNPRVAQELAPALREVDDLLRSGTRSTTTTSPILQQSGQPFSNTQLGHAGTQSENVKLAMRALDNRATQAYRTGQSDLGDAFLSVRDSIDSLRMRGLPPDVAPALSEVNRAYTGFKQLERANSMLGAQKQGVVSPSQLLNAQRAGDRSGNKAAFSRERVPFQQDALRAQRVLGSELPEVGPGTAEKLLPFVGLGAPMVGFDMGATALLGTQTGQNLLLGKYGWQGRAGELGSRYLIPALRAYGTAENN